MLRECPCYIHQLRFRCPRTAPLFVLVLAVLFLL